MKMTLDQILQEALEMTVGQKKSFKLHHMPRSITERSAFTMKLTNAFAPHKLWCSTQWSGDAVTISVRARTS